MARESTFVPACEGVRTTRQSHPQAKWHARAQIGPQMFARHVRGVVVDAKNDYQNRQGAKAAKIRIQKSLASLAAWRFTPWTVEGFDRSSKMASRWLSARSGAGRRPYGESRSRL